MSILFFDLENATSKNGIKICEFGYVLTDDVFNVTERGNLIIDPHIPRSAWDWYVVRKLISRKQSEYEKGERFDFYYPRIKELVSSADFIVGHTLDGDVRALKDECKRYGLPTFDFEYYDEKTFYQALTGEKRSVSVTNILAELGVQGDERAHDAEADAYNTMLGIKAMAEKEKKSFSAFCEAYPRAKYKTDKISASSPKKKKPAPQKPQGADRKTRL